MFFGEVEDEAFVVTRYWLTFIVKAHRARVSRIRVVYHY